MRPIKFRGKSLDGTWYYGDLVHINNSVAIKFDPELEEYELVIPNTVSQLWGYDDEGNEIYEGELVQGFIGDWGRTPKSPAVISSTIKSDINVIYDTSYPDVSWAKVK